MLLRTILFLISLTGVGFFAGAEAAFLGMDVWAVQGLRTLGDRKATILDLLHKDSSNTLSAILIGTNVFTVICSVMGASLAHAFGLRGAAVLTIAAFAVTGLVFLFSELVPKNYASSAPTEIALAIAPALSVLVGLLKPLALLLAAIPNLVVRQFSRDSARLSFVSDEPVRAALGLAEEQGQVDKGDGEAIVGVLDSSDTKAADIMVPLDRVVGMIPGTPVSAALEVFRNSRFSRIPVIVGVGSEGTGATNGTRVVGIVYLKDAVRAALAGPDPQVTVDRIMRPSLQVSADDNLLDVLSRMRRRRVHMASVARDRECVGILTLEDILEEIVGDIPEDLPWEPQPWTGESVHAGPSHTDNRYLCESDGLWG